MKRSGVTLVLWSGLLAVAGLTPSAAGEFPAVEGWSPHSEVSSFAADNLWEYNNGAADAFIAYGFRELNTCDLQAGELTVAVEIYDMGTPLGAFGIYQAESSSSAARLPVGTAAQVSPPYQGLLLKNAYYVKVDAFEGELGEQSGTELLAAVAAALPGNADLPPELQVLPAENRVAGSEAYARQNFLSLKDLANCVHARYLDAEEREYQVFHIVPTAGKSGDSIWQQLARKWDTEQRQETTILCKEVPYTGQVGVARSAAGLIGVVGFERRDEMIARLLAVIAE